MEDENKKQLKRTRQQQKQENAEEKHEGSKLRSGKIRKINSVELSLSSRCRVAAPAILSHDCVAGDAAAVAVCFKNA